MFYLVHAGFDTLDVAFAGRLPDDVYPILEKAREDAAEAQHEVLVEIGPGKVSGHVASHGISGGYAFVVDTGPLGVKWMFKKNKDPREWNIFASPKATTLLAYGYAGTRDKMFAELAAMGAAVTDHSINRTDFAMDFRTRGFELHLHQFVCHRRTKISAHWDAPTKDDEQFHPSAVIRGRLVQSMTIGKQPGRQIIVYDKRAEAVEKQKPFWFKTWGVDPHDLSQEVWRVEVRAGKKELKDKYRIRSFEDFETGVGDVIVNALESVRYLADHQTDSNVSRQNIHPLWEAAQQTAAQNLFEYRSGLTPGQVLEIEREVALQRYAALVVGNAIGLCVALGMKDAEIIEALPQMAAEHAAAAIHADADKVVKATLRTRERLHFVAGDRV